MAVLSLAPAAQSAGPDGQEQARKRYSRGVREAKAAPAPPASAAAIQWEPIVGMDAQIFPSFVVSTATLRLPQEEDEEDDPRMLGEAMGFIGAYLDGVPNGSQLKVIVSPNAAMESSSFQGRAEAGAGEYAVYPKINYKYDALLQWRQPMPLNITMEVFVDGRSLGTQSTTVTVRSINDCPLVVAGDEENDEEDLDVTWMFAAYVNENHPFVDTLTREALESKIVDAFSGYQDSPEGVVRQVYAIWHALQQRGMRYSDISQSSAESPVVFSQHVRLFDESLAAKQANCVDGTVLFAAVLRKIGIEPYLVLAPGHMYLAFDLDREGEDMLGLETTMMGTTEAPDPSRNGLMPSALTQRFKGQASYRSFAAAIAEGTSQFEEALEKFDSDDPDFQLISLSEARQLGILPLAYRTVR
jgi:hypothetical protein